MVRTTLEFLIITILVSCTGWNIWKYGANADRLEPRETEDVTVQEADYVHIRALLIQRQYSGPIAMTNNRMLAGLPSNPSDSGRWGQAQYVMIPWILAQHGRSIGGIPVPDTELPFVIGDFWDEQPAKLPPDLVVLHQGPRIYLFERKPQ